MPLKKITKIIIINILILIILVIFLEICSGFFRIFYGKKFLPFLSYIDLNKPEISKPYHPCNEMKTDVLLSHVNNHNGKCKVKEGKVVGEYVVYNYGSNNNPILLTLGGSTTSGFYQFISNGDTYPKYLAELVSENYYLINGGVGDYNSLQELLKFNRDGSRFKNLKLVVSLNGINELNDFYDKSKSFPFLSVNQNKMNLNQKWIGISYNKSLFSKLTLNLTPNLRNIFINFSRKNFNLFKSNTVNNNLDFKILTNVDRWETNIKRLNALVELEGATFFVFLQPTMGLEEDNSIPNNSPDKLLKENLTNEYKEKLLKFYNEAKKRCDLLYFCIDISNKLPPTGNVYNDIRHANSKGNKIIANEIYKNLRLNFKSF